ncbi:MAG: sugar phosphate nucleotidyltransferase [Verrucomicrobiae bacterium]|nr:sugar phosphate nucleotidyltransferase [Verrucomicrobiae bacterium]
MKPTLLVLAAGIGKRYGGLKQVDPVGPNGETIIDYCIYDAVRAGFGRAVFVIRHDIERAFRETFGARFENRLPVDYAYQELDKIPDGFAVPAGRQKPWGTAHAILMAEPLIQEPFAAINADDFYGSDSFRVLADFLQRVPTHSTDYAMVGFQLRHTLSDHGTVSRGICRVDANGMVEQLVELLKVKRHGENACYLDADGNWQPLSADTHCSMNMWGFTPALFPLLREQFVKFLTAHGKDPDKECLIPTVVNQLIAERRITLKVLPTRSAWCGVTYQEDRPKVQQHILGLIRAGEYPQRLWS